MAGHDSVKVLVLISLLLVLDNVCVCLCRNISSSSICFEEERNALLQFKQSLSDIPHYLSSWKGDDCCRWAGVKCDRASGHVVMLQITIVAEFLLPWRFYPVEAFPLQQASFTASELNSSLLNLRYLSYLELSGIFFENVNVLKCIGSMKQLRYLNLSHSLGFGSIPREWGNLTDLEVLDLRSNYHEGVVEDIRWVSHLRALKYLDMSGLNIASIPREWGNLTELEVLDLHSYYHEGVVEGIQWVSHLQALKYLDMSGLNITEFGDPMQVISMLPSLSHLSLSYCGLYKFHQSSNRLGNFTSLHLRYLDLSSNSFQDPITSTIFQNMTSLKHLDLSDNYLKIPIRGTIFQSMTSLRHLGLAGSFSKSPIPSTIFEDMTSLRHLDLSNNDFNGSIQSPIFQNTTSLRHLDLSSNLLEGPILSTILRNVTSLRHLDLSVNYFNSSLPKWFDNLRSLVDLNLERSLLQSIEGGLFSFLRNKPFLKTLRLGLNELHEEIFSAEGNSSGLIGKNLERLEMSDNFLRGALPDSLGQFKNLKLLDLSYNQLTGSIQESHSLGQLQDLYYLDLSANSLRGTLSEIHFSNLSKLSHLDINYNHLAFEVDSDWIPPFSLSYIGMTSCEIGPEFPQWIRTQVNATEIVLANSSITGALPDWLCLMSFSHLDLSYNQISGSLPKFPSDLRELDLSYNQISGSLPKFPSDLRELHLSHNQINGPLPKFPSDLRYLDLSHNQISGSRQSLPKFPSNLESLDLSHNQISGSLPKFPSDLRELDLSYNQISGSLPKFPSDLTWLDLSQNLISGSFPQDIGQAMPNLHCLYLNDNLLSGPIPTSLCEIEALEELNLRRNELGGKIPTFWKGNSVSLLDLSSNKLSGVIPSSLGNFIGLVSIQLNNNSLHGEVPVTMNNCTNLKILDLGENKISGSVPHWFGPSFRYLQILRLRENMFNGVIPSQLCLLPALQILDLAVNNLTGLIPNCLGYMKGMKLHKNIDESTVFLNGSMWYQQHVGQVVKGIDLDYTKLDLLLMVNLDLSSNNLIGPIPEELTLLSQLRGLNLSRNFLSRGIPTKIGYMKLLESLDLSNNHLSGTIPQSFSAFTSLSKLNLSHNNFTGPIPKGNQIQTLDDPSIYADNPLLCGDPLQKQCPSAEAPQAPKEYTNGEGKFEKVMFYIVIMLGFATGFWGVIGSLAYKKNWRRIYFEYVDRKTDMVYVIVVVKAVELRRRLGRA